MSTVVIELPPGAELLDGTEDRLQRAFNEMLSGYKIRDPKQLLKTFDYVSDEMVILDGIEFVSVCEHHLMPFIGYASVGYLPGTEKGAVGLSKIARVVDAYSRRLQLQERLTEQIAHCLMDGLVANGVGVILKAKHQCLSCRGAKKTEAVMKTSSMLGYFRVKPEVRAEFLDLLGVMRLTPCV